MNKRHLVIGLSIIAAGLTGYYAYAVNAIPAHDPLARYREAMRQDTQGGKTPEETLRLFVSALREGNIELASAYFILEGTDGSRAFTISKRTTCS